MKYISFRLFIEGKQDYLTVILKGGDIQPKAPFSPCSKEPFSMEAFHEIHFIPASIEKAPHLSVRSFWLWGEQDSNLRRRSQQIYSLPRLTASVSPH
jgi:hypothetical protein